MWWGGEVPHGEKMLYSGTDPESYITKYTLVYEENIMDGGCIPVYAFNRKDFCTDNGSRQGQNLALSQGQNRALTGLFVPRSLDIG